ncbi:MAG: histidine kinase [Chloroflexi bacterium]|nr:histidine kinase [Chloroflexota bacterium]
MDKEAKKKELEEKLADLKGRWPKHSVPPHMWRQLEELEDELQKLEKEVKNN